MDENVRIVAKYIILDSQKQTLTKAVKYCIRQGILREFLSAHGSEVENMLTTEWNWDDAKRIWQEESEAKGAINKAIEMARKMLAHGKPIEEIIEFTELTANEIENISQSGETEH